MEFTFPWASLLGGMLLGLSATLLLFFNGKIAGISGILGRIYQAKSGDTSWRLLFVLGMVVGGVLSAKLLNVAPAEMVVSTPLVLVAGLLVGLGTKLGNGCTSGHGICGMGRLSKRSIVATMTFMAVAMATTSVMLHVL
ncbi:YeeE/YedE family protein [Vibrio methylphosphonaticus]|uniref:YeeE/YedE family protein n=1 Tax=Vibrio methylphosphonaticus TaxID=2946866 RepID=UPI00202A6A66|nr:YeeE/YedE family protein [Vibrio methylphosphonaticus]MCL9776306.1 YeeE/YedE family protein [Vibrio methylphosphonaticus]